MNPRLLSIFLLLATLFTLTACSPVGDQLTVVGYSVSERTFSVPGSRAVCVAQVGATLTVLKTYKGGGCAVTSTPDYYVEYSAAGVQEFRAKYGERAEETAGVDSLPTPCANRQLLVIDERNFEELREDYERFLDFQEEQARHAAFEKKMIEEQKRKNQVEKE